MGGFSFSFAAALFALPLAGVPVLLHLLYRQKSPVVQFSTLRFIKLSVQKTAARRRVQKWLLLACRALLVALLIWAVAQPVHQLASNWMGGSGHATAAIVVDTSYSMQLLDGQTPLLSRAEGMVQDLLRDQLSGAKVAVFQSQANPEAPEQMRDASAVLSEWTPLKPQANPKPLIERVRSAISLLDRQPEGQKWLIVVSDFQAHEFAQSLPETHDTRTLLLDLHPREARSSGVTRITLTPTQPIPGIPAEARVELTGNAGDARALVLRTLGPAGEPISQTAPVMATLDASGKASRDFPVNLPSQRWVSLSAELTADDAMQWDNSRSQLVEIPPRQRVGMLQQLPVTAGQKFLTLALDPSEGKQTDWPLQLAPVTTPGERDNAVVAVLKRWPDYRLAASLRDFANAGHNVLLFLSPELQRSWSDVAPATRDVLADLLPSAPSPSSNAAVFHAAVGDGRDPLLAGLTDDKFQLSAVIVRQMVPLLAEGRSTLVLNAVPIDSIAGARPQGLLFRKPVGQGVCFTVATSPDPQYTNFATHPTFLPLMVRTCLKTAEQSAGLNVELGHPLVLDAGGFPGVSALQIESPQHENYRVPAVTVGDRTQFVFDKAVTPGLYTWRTPSGSAAVAMTNVQLPADESNLTYRDAATLAPAGPDTVVATSLADFSGKVTHLTAPQPLWSTPLAIVLFLICLEALMGSWSKTWKPPTLTAFVPTAKPAG